MVYLYPKFIHDVSMNAARLNRLLKGKLSEGIPATNRSCADARLGNISFVGG